MLADRVRLARWIALAAAGAAGVTALTCMQPAAAPPPFTCGTSALRMTTLHVKLRAHASGSLLGHAYGRAGITNLQATPVFATPATDERGRWLELQVGSLDHAVDADEVIAQLWASGQIEDAFEPPETTLAMEDAPADLDATLDDDSCPITTPSFESYQGYLGPAPHGIDAPAAWRRGQRGAGVWFADVEGGWNAAHEDLPTPRITHVGGAPMRDPTWHQHGTAVLGEVVGTDNGKGVVGIAPDVERVITSSIGGTSVANAIDVAARALRPGDVLLIELQSSGPRRGWIPVEYYRDVYDAIRAATDRGVVVVEAAGNGNEDLDHAAYQRRFDRQVRDSGAILVGAGGPPRAGYGDRERLDFSNYGSRVDVQGWGRKVATLDYGDLQQCAGADRHYTGEFSGTSSASPIVAGAAILVQATARQGSGVLAPRALRELLRATGTPQQGNTREHIGPRPDLARALRGL